MARRDDRASFLDGLGARILAGIVLIAALGAIAFYHRHDLMPAAEVAEAPENPQLAACLEERLGAVDRMREEGVVDEAQYVQFRARAEALCEGQFGGGPVEGPGIGGPGPGFGIPGGTTTPPPPGAPPPGQGPTTLPPGMAPGPAPGGPAPVGR